MSMIVNILERKAWTFEEVLLRENLPFSQFYIHTSGNASKPLQRPF